MRTKIIISLSLSCFNLLVCVLLILFCMPSNIPLLINFSEIIIAEGSKWVSLVLGLTPLLFSLLLLLLKEKFNKFLYTSFMFISLYEAVIFYIMLCTCQPQIGELFPVSVSIVIFLPLSFFILMFGASLKSMPFNSKLSLKLKHIKTNQVIFKQSHIFASKVFIFLGLFLLIISAIFSLFHISYVLIIVFTVMVLVALIVIQLNINSNYKYYAEMKSRKDKLDKKNK